MAQGAGWSGKKILVTGASGMLGRCLLSHFKGASLTGVSRRAGAGVEVCDLVDERLVARLFQKISPELVIHSAAFSDVDGCERDPNAAHESNALSTKNLSAICAAKSIPLIYISTNYVFSGQKAAPYLEGDEVFPVNVYGLTKLEGEQYVRQKPGPWTIVRTSWLFGAGNPKNFVNAVLEQLRYEKTVRVLADQIDSPTYVEDLAQALERVAVKLLAAADKRGERGTLHICNRGQATRLEMARRMKEWCQLDSVQVIEAERKDVPGRLAIRPAYSSLSSALYEKTFSTVLREWKESLREYVTQAASCASS